MSNMSYCRFHNTSLDFDDCAEVVMDLLSGDEEEALSGNELSHAVDLLMRARDTVQEIADVVGKSPDELTDDDISCVMSGGLS